ncbi:MAG: isocitrate lyase/PEP mutase family protein [Rubrivivax sp.]
MHSALASAFRSLHRRDGVFCLPNAWDAASACLAAKAGAPAVATSSAALCWSLGYADGGSVPKSELIAAVQRMTRVLNVPLSVDLEDGYSRNPEEVADLVQEIHRGGAVGINLEDGEGSSELLAAKIQAIRSRQSLAEVFINARTDVYLRDLARGVEAVEMVRSRARQYSQAGADGLFVPGLAHADECARVVASTELPVNLMVVPGLPSTELLGSLGVRRLTSGPWLFLATHATLLRGTAALLHGDVGGLTSGPLSFGEMNTLFATTTANS